jgi:hypothetical protein
VFDTLPCFATSTLANTNGTGTLRGSIGITKYGADACGLFVKVLDKDGVDVNSAFTAQLICPPNVLFPAPKLAPVGKAASAVVGGENMPSKFGSDVDMFALGIYQATRLTLICHH